MLRINYEEDREVIATAVGVTVTRIDPVIMRIEKNVRYGGFMFTNFTGLGGSIWGHAAGFKKMWTNREVLAAAFGYVFNQLECRTLFTRVAEDNLQALDFNKKLGFVELYELKGVYPDGRGQVIFHMLPDACRWLNLTITPKSGTLH